MDDSNKKFQTGSSDGRAQEQKEWARIRKLEAENAELRGIINKMAEAAYRENVEYVDMDNRPDRNAWINEYIDLFNGEGTA